MSFNVAIDGPAGAGKSTVSKLTAKKLGFIYVDTGAMYRAVGLYFSEYNIQPDDEEAVKKACNDIDITILYESKEQQIYLNKKNITALIRSEEASRMASKVALLKMVRIKLVELQQKLAKNENVVMDGRDIGTCVLPEADVKVYLTASVEERAKRRYEELVNKDIVCNLEEIKNNILDRDQQDMNREVSPLRQAEDACYIDCSHLNIEQVSDKIIELVNQKRHNKK